jgi:hypothetical protein
MLLVMFPLLLASRCGIHAVVGVSAVTGITAVEGGLAFLVTVLQEFGIVKVIYRWQNYFFSLHNSTDKKP